MKAIPTIYKGIQFRSRLEAKWAIFFDLMNWQWQYEPCDFNGWIPDFALYGSKQTTYVEVKPTIIFLSDIANKIDLSGCNDEVLLIGETCPVPFNATMCGDKTQIGWIRAKYLGYPDGQKISFCWNECEFACYDGSRIGFSDPIGCWYCRIYGTAGKYYRFNNIIEETVLENWAQACNYSQWKKT